MRVDQLHLNSTVEQRLQGGLFAEDWSSNLSNPCEISIPQNCPEWDKPVRRLQLSDRRLASTPRRPTLFTAMELCTTVPTPIQPVNKPTMYQRQDGDRTGPCNKSWSQLYNVNEGISYASDWNSSCDNMADTMVKDGKYKSVACFNMSQSDFGIETGMYAQAWPSVGYDVSAKDFANNLACQLNPNNTVTECGTLGNLCDTNLFSEKLNDNKDSEIIQDSSELVMETLEAIVEAIGEALDADDEKYLQQFKQKDFCITVFLLYIKSTSFPLFSGHLGKSS